MFVTSSRFNKLMDLSEFWKEHNTYLGLTSRERTRGHKLVKYKETFR